MMSFKGRHPTLNWDPLRYRTPVRTLFWFSAHDQRSKPSIQVRQHPKFIIPDLIQKAQEIRNYSILVRQIVLRFANMGSMYPRFSHYNTGYLWSVWSIQCHFTMRNLGHTTTLTPDYTFSLVILYSICWVLLLWMWFRSNQIKPWDLTSYQTVFTEEEAVEGVGNQVILVE